MKRVGSAQEMKAVDRQCIEVAGVPSFALMERAGYAVFETLTSRYDAGHSVCVVSAMGNNGADGLVVARYLKSAGYDVRVYLMGDEERATEEMKAQLRVIRYMQIPEITTFEACDVIVDALFGIGLCKPVRGAYASLIDDINASGVPVVAVDIPSGIDGSSGAVLGTAVRATDTVTFGYNKIGLLLYPGAAYAGRVRVADIGFLKGAIDALPFSAFTYTMEDLGRLPRRLKNSHKGTYGRLAVIAGSVPQAGAAYLAGFAALKSGAGLVRLVTPSGNRTILQSLLPEAVMSTYERFDEDLFAGIVEKATHILMGPGLSQNDVARTIVDYVCRHAVQPLVIDADGINLLETDQMEALRDKPVILTPHPLEMQRLCARLNQPCSSNHFETARDFADRFGVTVILKDARTVVAAPHHPVYINTSGSDALAKGGTGDVLAGTIAGLLTQKMSIFGAACLGVYIHGLAGEVAAEKASSCSVMASEVATALEIIYQRAEDMPPMSSTHGMYGNR
ncbi:MAG: NAD(P)H-hydrate dehydratase [Eubacteriales bacterium]|nr:NAD(P)H-hydrate dehydratase [Eubacteriales bacterium]